MTDIALSVLALTSIVQTVLMWRARKPKPEPVQPSVSCHTIVLCERYHTEQASTWVTQDKEGTPR